MLQSLIFAALHYVFFSILMSLWWDLYWTQYLSCGLAKAEGKRYLRWSADATLPNVALDAISLLYSKEGSLLVHIPVNVHQHLQFLFCKAAFQLGTSSMYWCLELFLPGQRTDAFLCWTSLSSSQIISSRDLSRSLHEAAQISDAPRTSLFCVLLLRVDSASSSRQLVKMLNRTRLNTESWIHH